MMQECTTAVTHTPSVFTSGSIKIESAYKWGVTGYRKRQEISITGCIIQLFQESLQAPGKAFQPLESSLAIVSGDKTSTVADPRDMVSGMSDEQLARGNFGFQMSRICQGVCCYSNNWKLPAAK